MEPMPPTAFNRGVALTAGFVAGIGAQILFSAAVNAILGTVATFWSGKTALWAVILLLPPVLTRRFLVVVPGSMTEQFVTGMQAGAFLFIVILVGIYISGKSKSTRGLLSLQISPSDAGVRHKSHIPGDFHRIGHAALVLVGQLVALGRLDFELGGDELSQEGDILIVDFRDAVAVENSAFHGLEGKV
jgi:hypothetical protein